MVTIEIKENSKQAKAFIELAKTLSFVNFKENGKKKPLAKTHDYPISKNVPNAETLRILRENDRNNGKGLKKFDNLDELIEELNS